jgi:pimeloyl-ACP methyl ester carboxylesterase
MVAAQDGPTLLVGHSYGGMVISGAGNAPNVVGLVYVAAFALDEGENIAGIAASGPAPSGAASIQPDKDGFLWIARDKFHESFCADLDETEALIMAVTQKPLAARCFADKSGPPAWKTQPSWYQISANDNMIGAAGETYMASRINPKKTITLPASHASLASHPVEISALIEEAANTVGAFAVV